MSIIKSSKNIIPTKFKKRKKIKNYNYSNLKIGSFGFFCKNEFRFEFIYFSLLKKLLKYNFRAKIKYKLNKKYWVFLSKNYPISSKSKNSRMGKGKGAFVRWSIRLKKYFIFFEILGLNLFRSLLLFKIFKKKIGLPLYFLNANTKQNLLWMNNKISLNFVKKYNYI